MSQTAPWTISSVLSWATDDFRSRGFESPRLEAELLLVMIMDTDRIGLIRDSLRPLSADELSRYRDLIARRRKHEPIAYIMGKREFYGRNFQVDPRVLIPRPDTEILVETALRRTRSKELFGVGLDLCTGSGCVIITLALERRSWKFIGSDISTDALEVAQRNALRLGAIHNLAWHNSDLFAALPEHARYDLITANPPYITEEEMAELAKDISEYEPHLALFGGVDGLDLVRKIIDDSAKWLRPGGVLALEIGYLQAPRVAELMLTAGFQSIEKSNDYGGHERVVSGIWPDSTETRRTP